VDFATVDLQRLRLRALITLEEGNEKESSANSSKLAFVLRAPSVDSPTRANTICGRYLVLLIRRLGITR